MNGDAALSPPSVELVRIAVSLVLGSTTRRACPPFRISIGSAPK